MGAVTASGAAVRTVMGVAIMFAGSLAFALWDSLEWMPALIPFVWAIGSVCVIGGTVAVFSGVMTLVGLRRHRDTGPGKRSRPPAPDKG